MNIFGSFIGFGGGGSCDIETMLFMLILISRDNMDQILLVTVSQIAMASALVLGIIATFVLLCKLCSTATIR